MTYHYWSSTEWFPLCLMSTTIITHRDSSVPWFPFDLIGGFLVFVNSLHNWLLFRESLLCAIPSGSCWIHTSVWSFQYFCLSPSKSLAFFYTSCWMMEDVLMPYFLSTSTHLIVGHISRIIVSTLGLVVISGKFPHY
jgi:hypothetical protein